MSSGLRTFGLFKLPELIAASVTFQALIAAAYGVAATAAEARKHVHVLEAIDLEDENPLPRVTVRLGQEFSTTKIGTGTWNAEGTVEACFEFPKPDKTASDPANLLAFTDTIGAILEEVQSLAGIGNAPDGYAYLNVEGITSGNGAPQFCDPQHENGESYLIDDYTFRWRG